MQIYRGPDLTGFLRSMEASLNTLERLVLGRAREVTSLPAKAADGEEVTFVADATNGVAWRLRYRAGSGSTHKWEFVGGSDLSAENAGSNEGGGGGSYVDLGGPQVTLPLAGDYMVFTNAFTDTTANVAWIGVMSFSIGGAGATDTNGTYFGAGANGGATIGGSNGRKQKLVSQTAGTVLKTMYKSVNAGTFSNRLISVRPVRVG